MRCTRLLHGETHLFPSRVTVDEDAHSFISLLEKVLGQFMTFVTLPSRTVCYDPGRQRILIPEVIDNLQKPANRQADRPFDMTLLVASERTGINEESITLVEYRFGSSDILDFKLVMNNISLGPCRDNSLGGVPIAKEGDAVRRNSVHQECGRDGRCQEND